MFTNKWRDNSAVVYSHSEIILKIILKRNEWSIQTLTWMNLEIIIPSEKTQTKRECPAYNPILCGIRESVITDHGFRGNREGSRGRERAAGRRKRGMRKMGSTGICVHYLEYGDGFTGGCTIRQNVPIGSLKYVQLLRVNVTLIKLMKKQNNR